MKETIGKYTAIIISWILASLIASANAFAILPTTINYQGYLTNDQGLPITPKLDHHYR